MKHLARNAGWVGVSVAAALVCTAAARAQAQADTAPHAALVEKTCVSCHNDKLKTAGLSLQRSTLADVPAHAEVWEKVLRKVRSGEMPPVTARNRPEPGGGGRHLPRFSRRRSTARRWRSPNPGRAAVHRLNRAEYSNAIRDLLAVDVRPGDWLPVDDSGYGFDNIADVLSTSPALLERYMSAARRVSRLAVGDLTLKPVEEIYDCQARSAQGVAQRAAQRRSAVRLARRHLGAALFPGRCRVRVQGAYSSASRRPAKTSGNRPLSGAHAGEGRAAFGRRHISARKPQGRERSARRGGGAAPAGAAAPFRRCRIRSISA